jgi:hypothetical protein
MRRSLSVYAINVAENESDTRSQTNDKKPWTIQSMPEMDELDRSTTTAAILSDTFWVRLSNGKNKMDKSESRPKVGIRKPEWSGFRMYTVCIKQAKQVDHLKTWHKICPVSNGCGIEMSSCWTITVAAKTIQKYNWWKWPDVNQSNTVFK